MVKVIENFSYTKDDLIRDIHSSDSDSSMLLEKIDTNQETVGDTSKQEKSTNLSELEALRQISDLQRRKYIREQLSLKRQIIGELQQEDLSVLRETELEEALEMISDNIQKIRVEGLL